MDLERQLKDYAEESCRTLLRSPFDRLADVAAVLLQARASGKWIFTAGNGGSAATASHMANDFVKGLSVEGRRRFKVMALNDGIPILTALANDYEYARCFEEQLMNYGSPGDVLVVFSGSGNSPNVVRAAEYARGIGMQVVSFGGRDGGRMRALSDVACVAATDSMESIEDMHMVWEHALILALRGTIAAEPEWSR